MPYVVDPSANPTLYRLIPDNPGMCNTRRPPSASLTKALQEQILADNGVSRKVINQMRTINQDQRDRLLSDQRISQPR